MTDAGKFEPLAREIMENVPLYSLSLTCTEWKYDEGRFTFVDDDQDGTGKIYTLTVKDIARALKLYFNEVFDDRIDELLDAGNWDASMVDEIIQLAVFGEVVYG